MFDRDPPDPRVGNSKADPDFSAVAQHWLLLGVLAGWAGASFACQALLGRGFRLPAVARAWLCSDAVCLTAGLAINRGHDTPLVAVYGLFVAASGLWLQVGLVRFTANPAPHRSPTRPRQASLHRTGTLQVQLNCPAGGDQPLQRGQEAGVGI